MSHRPALPPHLADDEEQTREEQYRTKKSKTVWLQWPSKYGPGGRRVAKAKWRKKQ